MYQIYRCGSDFCLVIATKLSTPPRFFRYATWQIHDHDPYAFNEISKETAEIYYGGIADGIGYEPHTKRLFESLEEMTIYIETKILMHWEKHRNDSPHYEKMADFVRNELIRAMRSENYPDEKLREEISRLPECDLKHAWISQFLEIHTNPDEYAKAQEELLEYLAAHPPQEE